MSFVYRGTSSDTMHFNITERQVYNAPAFDVNAIEVPGRSGDVLNSQNRFKNKTIVYTGFLREQDFPGDSKRARLSRGLRNLKAWICGDPGKYHDLTDDYDPGFIRRAFVSGETAITEIFDRPDGVTITITFYAEPFMYEVTEPIEVPEGETIGPADIATFQGVNAPLKSLIFAIEPSQDLHGYDYPWPGGGGKNLLLTKNNGRTNNGVKYIVNSDGTIELQNTATGSSYLSSNITYAGYPGDYTYFPAGTYYVKGGKSSSIRLYLVGVPASNTTATAASFGVDQGNGATFTLSEPYYLYTQIYVANGTATNVTLYPMVSTEPSATWEPYANLCPITGWTQVDGKQSGADTSDYTPITIALGQTVYGGTVDALNGKLTITHGYTELSSLSWTRITNGTVYIFDTTVADFTPTATSSDAFLSTYYTPMHNTAGYGLQNGQCARGTGGRHLYVRDDTYTTAADFKAAAAGKYICYPLATPIEVDLTQVSGLTSLLGQNNIWANTGDTTVEYIVPTENPTEWPSKPLLEITMSGAGTLTINGKTWTIGAYTGTLYCDPDIMDWYDAGALKNSLVSGDGFPEFAPGENIITYTGGITKVVATPRWRTL